MVGLLCLITVTESPRSGWYHGTPLVTQSQSSTATGSMLGTGGAGHYSCSHLHLQSNLCKAVSQATKASSGCCGHIIPWPSFYSKAKLACYSRYLLTSYFCTPVPYNEKDIFWGCQFLKVSQVFIEPFNFSFFIITGQDIDSITVGVEEVMGRGLSDYQQYGKTVQVKSIGFESIPYPVLQSPSYQENSSLSSSVFSGEEKRETMIYFSLCIFVRIK